MAKTIAVITNNICITKRGDMHVFTPRYIFLICMMSMRSYILISRSLSTFICPMAISITCKDVTGKGWHAIYKFILPCLRRSYRFSISISTSLRMDPWLSILCSSSIWSLLLPHLLCPVGGSISFSFVSRGSSLLLPHLLASGEAIFSHLPLTFGICMILPSCRTGLHSCMKVLTSCG